MAPHGTDERDAAHVPALDLLEQLAHEGRVGRAAEGQRARHRRLGHGPAGEKQRVVAEDGVTSRPRLAAVDVDTRERSERDEGPDAVRQLPEVEVAHLAEVEGLRDCDRAVPEARLGREQLDAEPALSELAQRESGFERRDPAAGDEDREGVSVPRLDGARRENEAASGKGRALARVSTDRPVGLRAQSGATGRRAAPDRVDPGAQRDDSERAAASALRRPLSRPAAFGGRHRARSPSLRGRRTSCHIPAAGADVSPQAPR